MDDFRQSQVGVASVAKNWLGPVLREAGWRRSGTTFRWFSEGADCAVIKLDRAAPLARPEPPRFRVKITLWPGIYRQMLRDTGRDSSEKPAAVWGPFSGSVDPPRNFSDQVFRNVWDASEHPEDEFAATVRQIIGVDLATAMVRTLTDRQRLIDWCVTKQPPAELNTIFWMLPPGPGVTAILLVDQGPSPLLDQALDLLAAHAAKHNQADDIGAWVRASLTRST